MKACAAAASAAQGQRRRGDRQVGGVDHLIVVHRTGAVEMDPVRDVYYHRPPRW